LRGEFNVPRGTKNAVLLDTDDFEGLATAFGKAKLRHSDFEPILDLAKAGDFVFVDPPYVTRHNFNGFAKYNESIFSWEDQIRLRNAVGRAKNRGAKVLVTNAAHSSIIEIYENLGTLVKLRRQSVIAASSNYRGTTTEVAITINYKPR
jgi:DNA adenine methylase